MQQSHQQEASTEIKDLIGQLQMRQTTSQDFPMTGPPLFQMFSMDLGNVPPGIPGYLTR